MALSWILASLDVSFGFALVDASVGEFLGMRGAGLLTTIEDRLLTLRPETTVNE